MELLFIFSSIIFVNLLAWITPGPNMIAVINASVSNGRQSGILTGVGLSVGAVLWVSLAVCGATTFFNLHPNAYFIFRILGAGYLFWLGIKAFRSTTTEYSPKSAPNNSDNKGYKAFVNGFVVTMTNPKAAFFFGSILIAFVPKDASNILFINIIILHGILALGCHTITATVFSTEPIVRNFNRSKIYISNLFGVVFISLGISVAYDAIKDR